MSGRRPAVSPIGGARYSAGCVGTHRGPSRERGANEGGTARLQPSSFWDVGVFRYMQHTLLGLREGALTIVYNAILVARGAMRQVLRPSEVGVRVVLTSGDSVALVRHRGGRRPWALPGGGVAKGETLAAAALREVREEAGCAAQLEGLLGLYHSFAGGMSNYIAVFICSSLGEVRAPAGDLEIVDARLFQRRDLPNNTDEGSLRRISEHGSGKRGIYGPW